MLLSLLPYRLTDVSQLKDAPPEIGQRNHPLAVLCGAEKLNVKAATQSKQPVGTERKISHEPLSKVFFFFLFLFLFRLHLHLHSHLHLLLRFSWPNLRQISISQSTPSGVSCGSLCKFRAVVVNLTSDRATSSPRSAIQSVK